MNKNAKNLLYGPRPQGLGYYDRVQRGMAILALNNDPVDIETDLLSSAAHLLYFYQEEVEADRNQLKELLYQANLAAIKDEEARPSDKSLTRPLGIRPLGISYPEHTNAINHARAYIHQTSKLENGVEAQVVTALSYLFAVASVANPRGDSNDLIRDILDYYYQRYY